MNDDFDFYKELMKVVEKAEKARVQPSKPTTPKVELTLNQKRAVVNYMLGGVGKGIFEDCPEIWGGVVEEDYSSYRQAADEFVEDLREKILKELS